MRILYVAMKHDYGKPENGPSFEHYNFFDALHRMGFDLIYFDPVEMVQRRGKEATARRLMEVVAAEKPTLMFTVLFTDQLDPHTVQRISDNTDTVTFNWFCDDHWRFDDYSQHWAPRFHYVSTTARSALPRYEAIGYRNVLKTQWAANHYRYQPRNIALAHDVSFVGRPHGNRRDVIDAVRRRGVEVATFGEGWPAGPIDHDMMLDVFTASRINLNLSNASVIEPHGWARARRWVRRIADRGGRIGALLANSLDRMVSRRHDPIADGASLASQQIKGRNFEVPACGGMLLTTPADDLETYFQINREVAVFRSLPELIEQVHHYLEHEDERVAVAQAGLARVLAEHTYSHRFAELFRAMLPNHAGLEAVLAEDGPVTRSGHVMEVA